ncbi:MAG: alpha/beta fold hydrolase [Eubacteriales bacterium]|nr:alpha/beta fold hydrolase [Eubacteriales bacterium]
MMHEQGKTGILFIHGILGTPEHFKPFLLLVPKGYSVCNLLLKGHGGSVRDLSRTSMSEWKQQVSEALDELSESCDSIIIVAHSMGTLFAIQEAIRRPIDELFLINVPLKLHITFRLIRTMQKVYTGRIKPEDEWNLAAQKACSIRIEKNVFKYLTWIPRYLELFSEIRKTRKMLGSLSTKSHVYLSAYDEMVSVKCGKLFENNPQVSVKMLNNSGHFYYSPEDQYIVTEDFSRMICNKDN